MVLIGIPHFNFLRVFKNSSEISLSMTYLLGETSVVVNIECSYLHTEVMVATSMFLMVAAVISLPS